MPFQAAQAIQVVLNWTSSGTEWNNVVHIGPKTGPLTAAEADDARTAVLTWCDSLTNHRSLLSDETVLNTITVRGLHVEGDPPLERTISRAGTSVSPLYPLEVSVVCTVYTAFAGRAGRGRIYWGGFSTDITGTDGQSMPELVRQEIFDSSNEFTDAFQAFGLYDFGVLSRKGPGTTETAAIFRPHTSIAVDGAYDTQRRRGNR